MILLLLERKIRSQKGQFLFKITRITKTNIFHQFPYKFTQVQIQEVDDKVKE